MNDTELAGRWLPDRVRVTASYAEDGGCTSVEVALNFDGIHREDILSTVSALLYGPPEREGRSPAGAKEANPGDRAEEPAHVSPRLETTYRLPMQPRPLDRS